MPNDRQAKIDKYGAAYTHFGAALGRFPREMWRYRSHNEQWTIHEIVVHIADSEANRFVRLRRLIAEPGQAVTAYDENAWARRLNYESQSPADALQLFRWLRHNRHVLILSLPEAAWAHTIQQPENGLMSMNDWLEVYARHVSDHGAQMDRILAERQAPQPI
jgi:DinB superfamily